MPLCALENDNRVVFATTLLGTRELALVFRRRQRQWFSGGIYTIFTFLEGFLWNTPVVLLSASHLQDAHHKKNGNAYVYVIKLRKKSRRKRNPQPEAGWGFKVLFDSVSRSAALFHTSVTGSQTAPDSSMCASGILPCSIQDTLLRNYETPALQQRRAAPLQCSASSGSW